MNLKEVDWAGWGMIALAFFLMAFAIFIILVTSGCTTMRSIVGMPVPAIGSQMIIPSSPASQMWKVVAKSNWVVTICLLGFGAGLFTFFNGNPKLGLAIVFSSLGTLFFGLAVHRFPTWMAIVGLLGAVVGVTASILMKHRAIIEIIKGGQTFKKRIESESGINLNFGEIKTVKEDFFQEQTREQSPTTQKLVKKIKSQLKLKGKI